MDFNVSQKILITHGLFCGKVLIDELNSLGYKISGTDRLHVTANGSLLDAIRLNMKLRTAHRVLFHLYTFKAYDLGNFYTFLKKYPWTEIIPLDGYFSISSFCNQNDIRDNRIVNLKAKDAIADHFMENTGRRPDSGNKTDRLVLFIYWAKDTCSVYIDTSGESIAKHGYRLHGWKAPLSEALACAIILSTSWDRKSPFVNPMCGSGTLAIEAALMASNRYPGLFRKNYSYMHIRDYKPEYNQLVRTELEKSINRKEVPEIIATDIHAGSVRLAIQNAENAGVKDLIHFSRGRFQDTAAGEDKGIVIMNPGYGERMGEVEALRTTYREIGDYFKNQCRGMTGYVLTGNPELGKSIGLRTNRKLSFMNGNIECRLLEYELYEGSRKRPGPPGGNIQSL